jgi:hypothetical protein
MFNTEELCMYDYEYNVLKPFFVGSDQAGESMINSLTDHMLNLGYKQECLEEKVDTFRNCILKSIDEVQKDYELDVSRVTKESNYRKAYVGLADAFIKSIHLFAAIKNPLIGIPAYYLSNFFCNKISEIIKDDEKDEHEYLKTGKAIRKINLIGHLESCLLQYLPEIWEKPSDIQKYYIEKLGLKDASLDDLMKMDKS